MTPRHNALPWLMTLLIELWKTGMVWCYASSTWELWLKALDNTKVFQSFYKRKYIYYIHITLYAVFYFYSYLIDIGCIHTQLYNRKLFNKKTSKNIFNINTCTPFFLSSWWSIDKCLLPNKTRTHFVILFFFLTTTVFVIMQAVCDFIVRSNLIAYCIFCLFFLIFILKMRKRRYNKQSGLVQLATKTAEFML